MPRLKQPASLQNMAMDILVGYFSAFCYKCSTEDSVDELHRGVVFIKTNVGSNMTRKFAAEFYNRLLERFSISDNPTLLPPCRDVRIILQALLGDKIMGLECLSVFLASLNWEDISSHRGFTKLELKYPTPYSLKYLHIENLTTFKHVLYCTDADLVVIGRNCPRLKYADASCSREVTNVGLLALASCANLRFLSVERCSAVSVRGLKYFLEINKTINELSGARFEGFPGFDYFEDPNWALDHSVHPSIESFSIDLYEIGDRHLHFFVAKFPNLTAIKIAGTLTGDVCILKSLSKLSKIDYFTSARPTCAQLEPLLKCLGTQIKHLEVQVDQRGLDMVFELCSNLEYLRFGIRGDHRLVTLVIPPFQKLKNLVGVFNGGAESPILEFGQMVKLENLEMEWFSMGTNQIKSMILDHTTFPNMKQLVISNFSETDDFDFLRRLVKENNLDLKLEK